MDKDPVCGMAVSRTDVGGRSQYKDRSYYFCSPACKEAFDTEPERYAVKRVAEESRRAE
jgi:YHS domain-containing protein